MINDDNRVVTGKCMQRKIRAKPIICVKCDLQYGIIYMYQILHLPQLLLSQELFLFPVSISIVIISLWSDSFPTYLQNLN